MLQTFRQALRDSRGATAIEYAVLASMLSIAAIAGMTATGDKLDKTFCFVASSMGAGGGSCSGTQTAGGLTGYEGVDVTAASFSADMTDRFGPWTQTGFTDYGTTQVYTYSGPNGTSRTDTINNTYAGIVSTKEIFKDGPNGREDLFFESNNVGAVAYTFGQKYDASGLQTQSVHLSFNAQGQITGHQVTQNTYTGNVNMATGSPRYEIGSTTSYNLTNTGQTVGEAININYSPDTAFWGR